jgi:hypothetical protein
VTKISKYFTEKVTLKIPCFLCLTGKEFKQDTKVLHTCAGRGHMDWKLLSNVGWEGTDKGE